jgi:hypothetical protein
MVNLQNNAWLVAEWIRCKYLGLKTLWSTRIRRIELTRRDERD